MSGIFIQQNHRELIAEETFERLPSDVAVTICSKLRKDALMGHELGRLIIDEQD
jgi:hypothetical protein